MYYYWESPIGGIVLELREDNLTGLWFEDHRFLPSVTSFCRDTAPIGPIVEWLEGYFRGEAPETAQINIEMVGSEFQKLVWNELTQIPYGDVTTYGAVAKALEGKLGHPVAAQAVGGAVGHNPISLIVPCHRVVGAGGKLTGYGNGLWRKEYLLALESKNA